MFLFKKIRLIMSSGKWGTFCLGLSVLTNNYLNSHGVTQRHSNNHFLCAYSMWLAWFNISCWYNRSSIEIRTRIYFCGLCRLTTIAGIITYMPYHFLKSLWYLKIGYPVIYYMYWIFKKNVFFWLLVGYSELLHYPCLQGTLLPTRVIFDPSMNK